MEHQTGREPPVVGLVVGVVGLDVGDVVDVGGTLVLGAVGFEVVEVLGAVGATVGALVLGTVGTFGPEVALVLVALDEGAGVVETPGTTADGFIVLDVLGRRRAEDAGGTTTCELVFAVLVGSCVAALLDGPVVEVAEADGLSPSVDDGVDCAESGAPECEASLEASEEADAEEDAPAEGEAPSCCEDETGAGTASCGVPPPEDAPTATTPATSAAASPVSPAAQATPL